MTKVEKHETIDIIVLSAHISAEIGHERAKRGEGGSSGIDTWRLKPLARAVPHDIHEGLN